jgi:hypothetical protein
MPVPLPPSRSAFSGIDTSANAPVALAMLLASPLIDLAPSLFSAAASLTEPPIDGSSTQRASGNGFFRRLVASFA